MPAYVEGRVNQDMLASVGWSNVDAIKLSEMLGDMVVSSTEGE